MTRMGKEAREWAAGQIAKPTSPYGTWLRYCLAFVRIAFGRPAVHADAGKAWDSAEHKHRTSEPANIPADVPVFWELPSVADHVAYSLGDGWCLSNDILRSGKIDRVRIQTITSRWGAQLLGWTEDLNGDRVWNLSSKLVPPQYMTLTFQFNAMQFSDGPGQKAHDVDKIFSRRRHVHGGTEADATLTTLLKAAAEKHGYRFFTARDEWVAVRKDIIDGQWETGFEQAIDSSEGKGRHSDRGVAWVSFWNHEIGKVSVGVGHMLTDGRRPGAPNYQLNTRFDRVIEKWGRKHGRGGALAFYMGDQNDLDRKNDTFRGGPFTSIQDELGQYEKTHRVGDLDVIASYDLDGRVVGQAVRVLGDDEFRLFADHKTVEAEFRTRKLMRS